MKRLHVIHSAMLKESRSDRIVQRLLYSILTDKLYLSSVLFVKLKPFPNALYDCIIQSSDRAEPWPNVGMSFPGLAGFKSNRFDGSPASTVSFASFETYHCITPPALDPDAALRDAHMAAAVAPYVAATQPTPDAPFNQCSKSPVEATSMAYGVWKDRDPMQTETSRINIEILT